MKTKTESKHPYTTSRFEHSTRLIRWITIAITLVTIPYDQPQSLYLASLIGFAIIYNLSRHSNLFLKSKIFSSNITILSVDNIFITLLLLGIGNAATPYSIFLILVLIAAAYRYGLKGSLITAAAQTVILYLATMSPWYVPLSLSELQIVIIGSLGLATTGLLVEQLTHVERDERNELERLGRENEIERKRLLTLINSLDEAIFLLDSTGKIELFNEAAQLLVPGKKDLQKKLLHDVLPVFARNRPDSENIDVLSAGQKPQRRRDLSIKGEHSKIIDLDISVMPVLREGKKYADYILICQDITKERSLDNQREEFIAVASHELRTPLAIMEAALSTALLSKSSLETPLVSMLEQAHRNAVFLAGIVRDLTTLAEAQNDSIPIKLEAIDPAKLLGQLKNDFRQKALDAGIELSVKISPNTPSVLSTEHHIHEILQNYVTNALKYTPKGAITLSAAASHQGGLLLGVKDSGIGISARDIQHLFTKFYRVEDYRTRETGGTGLGLYLCLELANRLNAKVWCESEINKGSTFYLEVPQFSQLQRDRGDVVKAQISTLVDGL